MTDFNTAEKKFDFIRAKYELSKYSTETFMQLYNREDLYYELLSRLETIMVLDPDFILLGNHIDKYQEIINIGRFRYKTHGDIRRYENLTLTTLNVHEQTKEEYREKYLLEQLKIRLQLNRKKRKDMLSKKGIQQIDAAICGFSQFDYYYLGILNQLKRNVEIVSTEPALKYLSSINYLVNYAKEIFYEDSEYCDASLSIIDTFQDNYMIPTDYSVRKIKKKLNSAKKGR